MIGVVARIDDDARLPLFPEDIGVAFLPAVIEPIDFHKTKNKAEALLFRLFVESLFLAARAILHLFHLIGMVSLIASGDIVLFATDTAFENDVITLRLCHGISHFFLLRL